MLVKKWNKLPQKMQIDEIVPYYNILRKKRISLFIKRFFDIFVSIILIILLSPLFIIIGLVIKLDSRGPVFYKQSRITQYYKEFKIIKFRTMIVNADKNGSLITVSNDNRITKVGKFLRKSRLDEIPQLFNILSGSMTFVGTRPEVPKYVNQYSNEMIATLLLPAGVTSLASIKYKDEQSLLDQNNNIDSVYLEHILPIKMIYNLKFLKEESLIRDIKILFLTVVNVLI